MPTERERPFVVTSETVAVYTDLIFAPSKAEAIRRVKSGEGFRISLEVDDEIPPRRFVADDTPVDL